MEARKMNVSSSLKAGTIDPFEEERVALRKAFLQDQGLRQEAFVPLPVDASKRRYFRGPHALLVDAPLPHEDTARFQRIAELLNHAGLTVPHIYATDHAQGFMLVEDLGEMSYRKALQEGLSEDLLYGETVKALAHLHRNQSELPNELGSYDLALFLKNVSLFLEWIGGPFSEEVQSDFIHVWTEAYQQQPPLPQCLILRDVMMDNLLWLPDRQGFQRCGFIDFQDGVRGPISYDLVSLLEDARRDIPPSFAKAMVELYFQAFPDVCPEDFWANYYLWGAQRSTRILGLFSRLAKRDGKPHYLAHLPRVWTYLERDLVHPRLQEVKTWFEKYGRIG